LEQWLATVVSRPSWSEFIYKVSQSGDEIKANAVVHHIWMDADPTYIVAVSRRTGAPVAYSFSVVAMAGAALSASDAHHSASRGGYSFDSRL
jgi:hypothetical protein